MRRVRAMVAAWVSAPLCGIAWIGAAVAEENFAFRIDRDGSGELATLSTNNFNAGSTNGFFANLGTNGRTCGTCHVEANAWTFTPQHAQSLSSSDPLFTPNDGSDCPATTTPQAPNSALSTEVMNYGLIRIMLGVPPNAGFQVASATNPKNCAIAPASTGASGQLFLFRRPPPATNLIFDTAIMWDGRETLQGITTQPHQQSTAALLFDLSDQANGATTGHAQGASIAGTQAQSDIVTFETNTMNAQLFYTQGNSVQLNDNGGHGGTVYLQQSVAPAFFVGINDPLKPGFTGANFNVYAAWEPTSSNYPSLNALQQSIGRGEAIFNNTTFVIHDVPGLNSDPSDPLYNASDPLAGQDITGGCAICHNSPNVGNHSSSLAINIGVTMAQPTNNDGSRNTVLDIANLPVYTLKNSVTGATIEVTDPGKAMISGKWTDIGKTKGPNLRGLAARAPYFHNGSAKDLTTVVDFYNARFNIGLTSQQISDLVAFLNAL
jgi:cytochrome c peroxidase